ncbi:MAG: sulfotransferase family 2 domain-containing protein [Thermotogota bacterium]|nr:sulfotransferase family 2 domain-containing protein [Thermotogota bacterium]
MVESGSNYQTMYLNHHFRIDIYGGVGYCYIRKNACSVFKKMIVDTSMKKTMDVNKDQRMRYMGKYHRVTIRELQQMDITLVVLREPLERIVSAFLNQFVMRLNRKSPEMHDSIEEKLQIPAEEITFEAIVKSYLTQRNINNHFWPQYDHLAPIVYTHACRIESLWEDIFYTLGKDIADQYFRKPINSTSEIKRIDFPDAYQMSSKNLFDNWYNNRVLPTKENFLVPAIRNSLLSIYEKDVALWESYLSARKVKGKQPPSLDMRSGI